MHPTEFAPALRVRWTFALLGLGFHGLALAACDSATAPCVVQETDSLPTLRTIVGSGRAAQLLICSSPAALLIVRVGSPVAGRHRGWIPYTITNASRDTLYTHACGGHFPAVLERYSGLSWRYHSGGDGCQGDYWWMPLPPAQSLDGAVRYFDADGVSGVFRIAFGYAIEPGGPAAVAG
ncbi:MAG: hypothetical protein GTO22_07420, partial [Gemmatimonadales bacterium]|nr:hypothetical protein [Gemmatimonadales bacterium]